ncbi:hypothetical protein Q7P37_005836 [Cladosporium fusiforme]
MSFSASRKYERAILEPINVPVCQSISDNGSLENARAVPSDAPVWTSTTHIFSGTTIRTHQPCWPPAKFDQDPAGIPDIGKGKAFRGNATAKEGVYHMYGEIEPSVAEDANVPPPRLVAKRYLPKQDRVRHDTSKPALTLMMLPGMSLPKEVFEPMIEAILGGEQSSDYNVAEIWSVDMPMSGQTALANPRGYLYGGEKDIARDIMLFVTAYLPVNAGQDLPSELIPRSLSEGNLQLVRPNLHVVAHSMGAQSAMFIAAHAPELFASLTMFDPAVIPAGPIEEAYTHVPTEKFCKGLDYEHESRDSLVSQLKANRRTRSWDPRIKEIFAEHSTIPNSQGGLQTTAHPRLEWALYRNEKGTPSQCYSRFGDLKLPINAIMPARPFAVPAKMFEADLAKLPQKTRLTWVPNTTHQLPWERVDECAELVAAWLGEMSKGEKARL